MAIAIDLQSASSQAGAAALTAGAGAPGGSGKQCWDCGAPGGKVRRDGHACPTPNSGSGNFDTRRNKAGGRKGGGSPEGKGGRGLSSPCTVDYARTQPKSDPQACIAYLRWEIQQFGTAAAPHAPRD